MKQKKYNFIKWVAAAANVIIVIYALGVIGTVAVINPFRPKVSEIEKRKLATKPQFSFAALGDGSYTKGLSVFFADTFPARETFIKLSSAIKQSMGFRHDDIKLYNGAAADEQGDEQQNVISDAVPALPQQPDTQQPEPQQPEQAADASSSTAAATQEQSGARFGSVFTYGNTGYTIFGGSEAMGQWYAQVINAYGDILGENMRIYSIVAPTAIEFNLPEKYKSITVAQRPRLDNIKNTLSDKVEWVDVYDAIDEHKDEYLFFRTDHHWTSLGAYYAYTQFAKVAGFEPVSLQGLEKRTLNNFLGTLYSQTQDPLMAQSPDYVDYYVFPQMPRCYMYKKGLPNTPLAVSLYGEYAAAYNSYSVFLHGDFPVTVIDTGIKNGRRLAVVKESFGNAFVPFLVNNYERIVVIDQRYLQKGFYDVLNENQINELLFINNILAAHTTVRVNELITLPTRTYVPPPPEEETASEASQAQDDSEESNDND